MWSKSLFRKQRNWLVSTELLLLNLEGNLQLSSRVSKPRRFKTTLTNLPQQHPDPILGLSSIIAQDPNPNKVNLTVGIYKDENGVTPIFPSVSRAIDMINEHTLTYLPILGAPEYNSLVKKFLFQDCIKVDSKKKFDDILTIQTFSGTGALSLCSHFLLSYSSKRIIIPNITWGNHTNILHKSGFNEIHTYSYYNKQSPDTIDIDQLLVDLGKFSQGGNSAQGKGPMKKDSILLHACCHNPTGLDPTPEQWDRIFDKVHELGMIPVIDMAYQGLQSGDLLTDVAFLSQYINKYNWEDGFFLCQSFAKNMGLYGERIGSLSIVPPNGVDAALRENIELNLEKIVRSQYSSPSTHGAKIVINVLANPDLKAQWFADLQTMFKRIHQVRVQLHENLKEYPNFKNILNDKSQHGMFYFSNLNGQQINTLREQYSIYLTKDGRISLSGINDKNLQYVCDAFKQVLAN